jgi:hypothetical protein
MSLSWATVMHSTHSQAIFKIHFNIIPPTPRTSKRSLSPPQPSTVYTLVFSPLRPAPPRSDRPNNTGQQYKSWSSSLCTCRQSPVTSLLSHVARLLPSRRITSNDLLPVTGYKAALGGLFNSRHGADSGVGAGAPDAADGSGRAVAELAHSEHQQAQAGRVRAFRQGSLPVHLPYDQPWQLRLPWESALPVRTALPLLAAAVHRYVGICHHLQSVDDKQKCIIHAAPLSDCRSSAWSAFSSSTLPVTTAVLEKLVVAELYWSHSPTVI